MSNDSTQNSPQESQEVAKAIRSAAENASPAGAVMLIVIVVAIITAVPFLRPHWGTISWAQQESVTVVGQAQSREQNELAMFSVTVTESNVDKDQAVSQVNQEVTSILAQLESFGIPKEDIKTQSVSIYRIDEGMYIDRPTPVETQWQASNSIEVYVRDLDRISDFTALLARTNASNVYGPQLMLDPTNRAQDALMELAMQDAQKKAEALAAASGRSLGKVLNIIEGSGYGDYAPMYAMERGGAGGFPIEPGVSSVSKSLTVTFSLK